MMIDPEVFKAKMSLLSDTDQAKAAMMEYIGGEVEILDIVDDGVIVPQLERLAELMESDPDNGEVFILYHALWLGRVAILDALLEQSQQAEEYPDDY